MNAYLQEELKKHVSSLDWLVSQMPTAPDSNPPADDVFAVVDQPFTRSELVKSVRFHAEEIVKITNL